MSEGAPAKQRDRASTLSCCLWMTGIYIGSKSVNQTIVTHSYFLFGDGPTPTQHTPSLLCSTAEGLVPLTREPRSGQHLQPHSRREQITDSQHSTGPSPTTVQRPEERRNHIVPVVASSTPPAPPPTDRCHFHSVPLGHLGCLLQPPTHLASFPSLSVGLVDRFIAVPPEL